MIAIPDKNKDFTGYINHVNEVTGDIINVFEEFLSSKGIIIPNPERDENADLESDDSSNIYGSDYDELRNKIEELLTDKGVFNNQLIVNSPAGELIAYAETGDTPRVGITLVPKDMDEEIDLAFAEVVGDKNFRKEYDLDDTVNLYAYLDVYKEDYSHHVQIQHDQLKEAFNNNQ